MSLIEIVIYTAILSLLMWKVQNFRVLTSVRSGAEAISGILGELHRSSMLEKKSIEIRLVNNNMGSRVVGEEFVRLLPHVFLNYSANRDIIRFSESGSVTPVTICIDKSGREEKCCVALSLRGRIRTTCYT